MKKIKNQDVKKLVFYFFGIFFSVIIFVSIFGICKLGSWEAIYTVGQWAMVAVGIFVPIIVVILQEKMKSDKNDIKISNQALNDEVQKLKKQLEQMLQYEVVDKWTSKEDIFKYICISMSASTKEIAEHFSIDIEKTKNMLKELALVDKVIYTTLEYNPSEPSEDAIWFRKS